MGERETAGQQLMGVGHFFLFRDDQNVLKSTVVVVARAGKDTKNH